MLGALVIFAASCKEPEPKKRRFLISFLCDRVPGVAHWKVFDTIMATYPDYYELQKELTFRFKVTDVLVTGITEMSKEDGDQLWKNSRKIINRGEYHGTGSLKSEGVVYVDSTF